MLFVVRGNGGNGDADLWACVCMCALCDFRSLVEVCRVACVAPIFVVATDPGTSGLYSDECVHWPRGLGMQRAQLESMLCVTSQRRWKVCCV